MKEAVNAWLAAQPKTVFFPPEGIKKLVQRWKKCTEKQRDYVEKLCCYKLSNFIEIKYVSVVRITTDSPTYISLGYHHHRHHHNIYRHGTVCVLHHYLLNYRTDL